MQKANYYAGSPLNRLSYLRTSSSFLQSALTSPKAKFVLLADLNLLCATDATGASRLDLLGWEDVRGALEGSVEYLQWVDDASEKLETDDERDAAATESKQQNFDQPTLVFLGVDERSSTAQSLPLTTPTEDSTLELHSPHGVPYWAVDVTDLQPLTTKVVRHGSEFKDMRGVNLGPEEAALGSQSRALVDWNRRNRYCPACAAPTRSLLVGFKRTCIASNIRCPSKFGVQSYCFPRLDPVVIMAILDSSKERILLGRQRRWPSGLYSCLAGFIEGGETVEEAVRREVLEEAGIEIGEVQYLSSQPWPYPNSLMIGCICVAEENQTIRLDLDNELDDARYFTREEILRDLAHGEKATLSQAEMKRIDRGIDDDEGATERKSGGVEEYTSFLMVPRNAIANVLIEQWARGRTIFG